MVDASNGQLTVNRQVPAKAILNALSLDRGGRLIFVAGLVSGALASYRINGDTGELTPTETEPVDHRPAVMLITNLGNQHQPGWMEQVVTALPLDVQP